MGRRGVAFAIGIGLLASEVAAVDVSSAPPRDLMDLSLEELAQIKVTSVSKRAEPLARSAAAVHVITGEDMRRSGYTSIAEALRLVPGVQVARETAQDWAIGVRGFNTGLSNKLLVLIDGRSIYSPLFSGVFWALRDVAVEDIERIEVIRGPGATLWGANAVNGVINIITRRAEETAGWTVRGGGGSEERAQGFLRYGTPLGEDADLRLSAHGVRRDDQHRRAAPSDDYQMSWLQGRADWQPAEPDRISLLGEVFRGKLDQTRSTATLGNPNGPIDEERGARLGASLVGLWEHQLDDSSDLSLRAWYEYTDLEFTTMREQRHTAEVDAQHHFTLGRRQEIVWGGAYRISRDDVRERGITRLDPDGRTVHRLDGFVQNQITLWPRWVALTLGTKLGHNEFSGFELQPSARLALTPVDWITLWGAGSRAVRTPTRLENDAVFGIQVFETGAPLPFGDPDRPSLLAIEGNRRFGSEEVVTLEGGLRLQPHASLRFDAAGFYSRYDDLLTREPDPTRRRVVPPDEGRPDHFLIPLVLDNELYGTSYGAEVAGWWQVASWWRLHAWYAYLDIHLEPRNRSLDTSSEIEEDRSPHHQALLRSSFDLPFDFAFDGILRFVDRLPADRVDAYVELDLRLAWRFHPDWEAAVVGQNLLHDHHAEALDPTTTRVQRGIYGQLRWRFDPER